MLLKNDDNGISVTKENECDTPINIIRVQHWMNKHLFCTKIVTHQSVDEKPKKKQQQKRIKEKKREDMLLELKLLIEIVIKPQRFVIE